MNAIRSLGWRSRFISAVDPLPLQLIVDHPLLELNTTTATKVKTNTSLSQCLPLVQNMIRLMKEGGVLTAASSTSAAKKSRTDAVDLVSSGDEKETSNKKQKHQNASRKPKRIKLELSSEPVGLERSQVDHSLSWIEVLCTYDENKSKWERLYLKSHSPAHHKPGGYRFYHIKKVSILPWT